MRKGKVYLLIALLLSFFVNAWAIPKEEKADRFRNPQNVDRPWVYWYWLNGNVNEKGLMADLEAMHEAGIGTAMTFDIGIGVPGKVVVRSKEWFDLMKKAIHKADQLGLRMGFHSPGWANAGGPWITTEMAMKELTWSEVIVDISKEKPKNHKNIIIPEPPKRMDFYRDIAVLAFPTPEGDDFSLTTKNSVFKDLEGHTIDGSKLLDNDRDTYERLPGTFEIILNKPQTIKSFEVRASSHADSRFFVLDLWVYDDVSKEFRLIENIQGTASGLNDRPGMATASFEPVTASRFRFGFKRGYGNVSTYSDDIYLQEINLRGGYRMPFWHNKTGFGHHEFEDKQLTPGENDVVQSSEVIDITHHLKNDGTLDWMPKSGKWTILRLGYIPTGAMSQPLNRGLISLESDKYSLKAAELQYDSIMGPLFDLVGRDMAKRVFSNYHIDSYEVGWQNWSEVLPDEFSNRRGYNFEKYLVALTGRAVNSEAETNAFLWDFRRTMADCYADNHLGYFTKRANDDGIIFSTEAYDGPFEDLQTAGRANMPMTEIWQGTDVNSRPRSAAIYAGHTYGHNLIGSEQYTGPGKWDLHPWKMKNLADASMAYGINTFVMHVFTQQPWTDPSFTPGATLGPWGAHYDRSNTWWKESRGWHDYIARCQYMLRLGQPVADILYYVGDNAPEGGGNIPFYPPLGFDGDAINQEILNLLRVVDGAYILPSGKQYKYLMMPDHGEMTLQSLRRIESLVEAGGTVIGTKPVKSRTMADLKQQSAFNKLANKLFEENYVGKGRVLGNASIEDAILMDKLKADFSYEGSGSVNLKYNHRRENGTEIYYVSNVTETEAGVVNCRFRVDEGYVPQLWKPINGEIENVVSYSYEDGTVNIPIHFGPGDTKFIVFTRTEKKDKPLVIDDLQLNNKSISFANDTESQLRLSLNDGVFSLLTNQKGTYRIILNDGSEKRKKIRHLGEQFDLSRDWKVSFESRLFSPKLEGVAADNGYVNFHFDSLTDWSTHSVDGIKYYSGTASYSRVFELKKLSKNSRYEIDLGNVQMIARLSVNGTIVETLWKPPYRADITSYLRKGDNQIEVEITNTWPNRLIGDEQYPDNVTQDGNWRHGELWSYPDWVWNEEPQKDSQRVAFTTYKHWNKDSELFPAGMIGPVTINKLTEVRMD